MRGNGAGCRYHDGKGMGNLLVKPHKPIFVTVSGALPLGKQKSRGINQGDEVQTQKKEKKKQNEQEKYADEEQNEEQEQNHEQEQKQDQRQDCSQQGDYPHVVVSWSGLGSGRMDHILQVDFTTSG